MISVRKQLRSRALIRAHFLVCCVALMSCVTLAQTVPDPPASEQAPAQSPPGKQGARLEMDRLEVDLGQLVKGETAEARFAIHNRGDETLRILNAKPG